MFEKAKMPLIKGLSAALFTFMVLNYQNCAKPLEDIGMNSSSSTSVAACNLTLSGTGVIAGVPMTINYSYTPTSDKLRIIVTNNATAAFTQNVFTGNGTTTVTNSLVGSYTAYGSVEDAAGVSLATCQKTFSVITAPPLPPEPPPSAVPTITLTGDKTSCVGTCTLNLTHNSSNIASSGRVFKIVKLNGANAKDIACKSANGIVTTPVSLSYTAEPGLNSFVAYFVSNCTSPTAGALASATFNMTMNQASGYTYSWLIGAYGACSATACDTQGIKTRTVVCKRNDGVTVADSFCGTKPATTQICYARVCSGGTL